VTNLRTLLRKLEDLYQQRADLGIEIAEVERQIVATANEPKPRAKRSTNAEMIDIVRATVKVLHDAGEPLPSSEVAARLGIKPWAAAYRLRKAISMHFVEKVAHGRYRCTDTVPVL